MSQILESRRISIIYLVEIGLLNGGPTLYFSDRNVVAGGINYENYVEAVDGITEEVKRSDSTFLNPSISIKFRNKRFLTHDYLIEIGDSYPFDGADCTIKELRYIDSPEASEILTVYDAAGLAYTLTPTDGELTILQSDGSPAGLQLQLYGADLHKYDGTPAIWPFTADITTILAGHLDQPEGIDLAGFTCKVSSVITHIDRTWKQEIIDLDTWPDAWEDVGKIEPMIVGSEVLVPALRVDWGARTTLADSIDATQTTGIELSIYERFPTSGSIYIDSEEISFTGRSSGVLSGVTRAANSTVATSHATGATVWEKKSQYDSLLAGHQLKTVGAIYAEIQGELLRVSSGVSAVYSGGKHLLRATSQIATEAISDSLSVNTSDKASIKMNNTNGAVVIDESPGYDYLSFNTAAPAGTLTDVEIEISWQLAAPTLPTGAEYWLLNVVDTHTSTSYTLARIDSGGITYYYSSPFIFAVDHWRYMGGEAREVTVRLDYYNWVGGAVLNAHFSQAIQRCTRTIAITKGGGVVGTYMVDRFHALASGHADPDGSYGGVGTLIERPDHEIKRFLIMECGRSVDEIDADSFDAAGTFYASAIAGGYKFAYRIGERIAPSAWLQRMAFECRSILQFRAGKWYLDPIPDVAPAAEKTIAAQAIAGKYGKFRFDHTPIADLANDITAKLKRNYSRLGSESDWLLTSKATDTTSQGKYGLRPLNPDLQLECVRLQLMGDDIAANVLLQRANPLLIVNFPILWEHFDLSGGSTFDIDNLLYNARKFFIESFRRSGKGQAEVRGLEWWT